MKESPFMQHSKPANSSAIFNWCANQIHTIHVLCVSVFQWSNLEYFRDFFSIYLLILFVFNEVFKHISRQSEREKSLQ